MEQWQLVQRRNLPLDVKVELTKKRIREWYNYWDGMVYVAFSGGKDSTVLLDLVRSIYPDVPAMFADTGLEFPEIREFVKTFDNVSIQKPTYYNKPVNFKWVLEKYGYPVISKMQARYIWDVRNSESEKLVDIRLNGNENGRFKIAEKWKFMIDAPFKISPKCCDVMKKIPAHNYERETDRKPMLGILATESPLRRRNYIKYGCNAYENSNPKSKPMAFWTSQDVLKYINDNNLPYCSVYGDIKQSETTGKYFTTGYKRTGCVFCMFGVHRDVNPNRFQRLKETHPKLYKYCMEDLGIQEVLEYMDVPHETYTQKQERLAKEEEERDKEVE